MKQSEKNALEILRAEMRTTDAILRMARENVDAARRQLIKAEHVYDMHLGIKSDLQARLDEMMEQFSAQPPHNPAE